MRRSSCSRTRSARRSRCGSRRWPRCASGSPCCATTTPATARGAARRRRARSRRSARGVLAMLDERGLERVSFCGLSLGGAVGMWLAMHAPERIDRLVLACTSARFGVPARTGSSAPPRCAPRAWRSSPTGSSRCWFTPATQRERPELVRDYRAMMVSADPEGYAGCCEALAGWEPGAALGAITAPTLVLAGSEDPATPPAQAEAIRDRIPGARLHVLPGAGHLAQHRAAGGLQPPAARAPDRAAGRGGRMSDERRRPTSAACASAARCSATRTSTPRSRARTTSRPTSRS